ncbi:MAG: (Fe-S)-binding protein [Bacteroidetes bacterium]|nr:(Fe-S)-binding protein [Bacteroidota bacterium]
MTSSGPKAFAGVDIPSDDIITNCMHCGLCLPTCPTFQLTGLEKSSPRGRIQLIKAVAEGKLGLTEGFVEEMNFCLDCQACETACPAGVRYGSLVEAARAQIFIQGAESWTSRRLKRFLLGWVFADQSRLKILAILLRWYQRSGLAWFVQKSGFLNLISRRLAATQGLAPQIRLEFSSETLAEVLPAYGERRFRVGMLTGCIMDVAYSDVNLATVELLRQHGCDVVTPRGQACCGSLTAHNGDMDAARAMAKNLLDAFSGQQVDHIVLNSAGCGAFMKEYGHLFAEDPQRKENAAALSAKCLDLTQFLARHGYRPTTTPKGASHGRALRVTYHDACHLAHTQRVTVEPRTLLAMIPGIEFVELPEASWCCGSAGIYNVVRYDDAHHILERKLNNIMSIKPDVIVTGNPGCMLQIEHGLRQEGLNIRIVHTAAFLHEACQI